MAARILHRHDTAVQPRVRLLDESGIPVAGLAGATVRYTLKNVATGQLKITRASATVPSQTLYPGEVFYQLVAGDVDTVGMFLEEWEVTYSDGTKETFPAGQAQYVQILEDYDNI
jgi:hypothetical protein